MHVQEHGSITYNGSTFKDFVAEQTATFAPQSDLHLPEVTVRETFDFGARVQGIGSRGGKPSQCNIRVYIVACRWHRTAGRCTGSDVSVCCT